MAASPAERPYWVNPPALEHIGEAIRYAAMSMDSFADICERTAPLVAEDYDIEGVENIPEEGPLVVVKNHPCHFDFLLLGKVFAARPDIRHLVKTSRPASSLPPRNTLFIRKTGPQGHPADIETLQAFLRGGGSLMATPWGSMDHVARSYASLDRTIQNVARYATFANANVLPVHIDAERPKNGQLPLSEADIHVLEPIMATPDGPDLAGIGEAARLMYEKYAA